MLLFFVFAIILLFGFFKHKFSYWKRLGVPFIEPNIPYGNIQGQRLLIFYINNDDSTTLYFFAGHRRKVHSSQLFSSFYFALKDQAKFGGVYFITKPVIFVTDLDLLKNVLIKDFQYFHDRGMYFNAKDDPLSGNLLAIEGDYWKKLREKLTPTFTSGRIRQMVPTVVEVAEKLEIAMFKKFDENCEFEIKDVLSRFTTDIIGTCAFGIECNSLEEENAKFLEMGLKVFQQPRNSLLKQLINISYPDLARKLGHKTTRDDVSEFFLKVVRDVVEYREKNNIKRNDFMDLLLQLKNDGELADDGKSKSKLGKLTVEEIAAQVFVFFLAVSYF